MLHDQSSPSAIPGDNHKEPNSKERQMELAIAFILRAGVLISITVIFVGSILMFAHHPGYRVGHNHISYRKLVVHKFRFPNDLSGVYRSAASGDGIGIILVGLIVLLLTPIARVVAGNIEFMRQRDWKMSIITFIVLVVLAGSFLLGKHG